MMVEAKKIPRARAAGDLLPLRQDGPVGGGIACDQSGGKFGPFAEQLFVGDQTHSTVMRVFLEKVNGHYQGACFPFRQGFGSGSLSLQFATDGSLFVGGTNRGWGSRGNKPYSLERLVWTGKTPFEIHEMQAKPDGFELTFTEPVDPATAGDPKSYKLQHVHLHLPGRLRQPRGRPHRADDHEGRGRADGKTVRLFVDKLQEGHVHELHLDGVRSAKSQPLLHPEAYYTLNYIPEP